MKKQFLFVSAVVLAMTFTSCGAEEKKAEETTTETPAPAVEPTAEQAVEEEVMDAAPAAAAVEETKKVVKKEAKKEVKETAAQAMGKVETKTIGKESIKSKGEGKQVIEEVKKIESTAAPITTGTRGR
jgi:ABC-type uncharacterized transport system auxiliary subunit